MSVRRPRKHQPKARRNPPLTRFASQDIESALMEELGLTQVVSRSIWHTVLDAMHEAIHEGRTVSLSNIGTMTPYKTKGRRYKHPETNQIESARPTTLIRFRISKNLKAELDG
jgi:nucleoid DNA-binding protein